MHGAEPSASPVTIKKRTMLGAWYCAAAICQAFVQHYYPLAKYTSIGFLCITMVRSIQHAEPPSSKVSD